MMAKTESFVSGRGSRAGRPVAPAGRNVMRRCRPLAGVALLLLALTSSKPSSAVVCTFQGTGGSGGVNWATSTRWNVGGSGGSGTTCPPGPLDSAVFNTGSRGQVVDVDVDVGSITITSGFAGSVTVNSGIKMRVRGNFDQAARTWDASLGGDVQVDGDFILSGGTFSSPAGLLTVNGAFNKTGGTFTHNSGTVMLSSGSSQAFATNSAAFNNLVVGNGLVAYWNLDEGSGTSLTDRSGHGNTGTLVNGPAWVTGASLPTVSFTNAAGVSFDGTNDYATLGLNNYPQMNGPKTIAFWAYWASKPSSSHNMVAVRGATGGLQIGFNGSSGLIKVWKGSTIFAAAGSTATSGWHHIAYTYDGTTNRLYIDGSSAGTSTTAPADEPITSAYFGTYNGSAELFAGRLDEVRIYNRALASSDITLLAGGSVPVSGTQTVSGNPTIASDLTIATGTLAAGSTTITVANNWVNYGVFTPGTSTVVFNGVTAGETIFNNGSSFNNLTIGGTAPGAWQMTDADLTLTGTLAISGGTVTAPSGLLKIGGAFNKTAGTFTHNSGRVMLSSTSDQAFATNGTTFNDLYVNDGLAGYWKLDEGSGTAASDSSGYGNGGTLTNGPTWATSSLPSTRFTNAAAVVLDGTNDYVDVTEPVVSTNAAFSACSWVKFAALTGPHTMVSIDGTAISGFYLQRQSSGGKFGFSMSSVDNITTTGYTATGTTTPVTGTWYHVCGVYDGSTAKLYVNGLYEGTSASIPSTWQASGHTVLGTALYNGGRVDYLNGQLDDVRLYKRALTVTEIYALASGNQPGSYVATQTMSGAPTVAGNLVIASGNLSAGSNNISVTGDWLNTGGVFSASGNTVTFTGSGTRKVLSGGSWFEDVTFNDAGTYTLADNMETDPHRVVYMTAGTFSLSSYTLRTGDLNRNGSVTVTPSTGTVAFDADTSRTIDPGTFYNVQFEPVVATELKGYWKLDEGAGLIAHDYAFGSANNGTLTNAPYWVTTGAPTIDFVNNGALNFLSASSTYVDVSTAITPTNAAFSACAWVNYTAFAANQTIVSIDGTNISGFYLQHENASGKFKFSMYPSDSTGVTPSTAVGTTTPSTGTWYHVCGVFSSSTTKLYVNGSLEGTGTTLATTWAATGHTIIGAAKWSGSRADYVNGKIDDVRIYNVALSLAQIQALAAGRYPAGLSATPTYTLGYDTTVTGTFKLQSGTLTTSTFALNASTAGNVAYITGGTYTVGSAAQTFAGGLTVRTPGTLNLPTSGGSVKIGSTKILNIDGTLSASSTGATIQTAGAAGTYYDFNVGTSATATPTLNITGLQVKNTTSNGMYVNTVVGSSTTFTNFDNIAFSGGTGSYLLRIYASSLALYGSGLTFDGSTTSNLKLQGDGTSTGETRAYLGATCTNTPCESYDADDDSEPDGTGDTTVTGDEAVAQWLRGAYADTAGSIQGFPTTAFDWNTFTYWNTYVAYRDYSSTTDRLFARNTDGAFLTTAGGTGYYYDISSTYGDIMGVPRWTTEGTGGSTVHYVYLLTTLGYVFKLTDSGTAFTLVTAQAWPYRNGSMATATSGLAMDSSNLYWAGNDSAGARKMFSLSTAMALNGSRTVVADVVATPSIANVSGTDYLFTGTNGKIYRMATGLGSEISTSQSTATTTVYGRVTVYSGKVYFPEDKGTVWALSATDLSTSWSYPISGHGTCTANSSCTVRSLYIDTSTSRTYFGDKDGHVYVLTSAGAVYHANYPYRPGLSTDEFQTAPLYRNGVIVIGSTTGKVFVIDQNNGSGPAVYQTFNFQSAISTIAYDTDGYYIVGTADGKLYYLNAVSDPTSGST